MNKTVNLDNLKDVVESKDNIIINSFINLTNPHYSRIKGSGATREELEIFAYLMNPLLKKLSFSQKNGFYLGYIAQGGISEEFDVLRFGEKSILNIELKRKIPKRGLESVREQLERHFFYLSILNREVNVFSYIFEERKLYTIDNQGNFREINKEVLINVIDLDFVNSKRFEEIDLTDMLVSPYTDPAAFASHKYFLTNEQKQVKSEILKSNKNRIGLIGGPGTGKTLLLFDIAKHYQSQNMKVVIIFVSQMDSFEAEILKKNINLEVVPVKGFHSIDFESLDVLLIDESQRMWQDNFLYLTKFPEIKIIYSADQAQTLHINEERFNIQNKLKESDVVDYFSLKNKIRTNKSFSSFIQKLLDIPAEGVQPEIYSNISIVHFNDQNHAVEYMENLQKYDNFTVIESTEYITKSNQTLKREKLLKNSKQTHSVLGREYDNVLIPLDSFYIYDEDGRLRYRNPDYYPYLNIKMLFQALTRVKRHLLLVIIKNPVLYKQIQEIINWGNREGGKNVIK